MNEYQLIEMIAKQFPRNECQYNDLFHCDAEILNLDGHKWAFTIDEFSPEEDLFTSTNPSELGANLITATLSDLLAAGAQPQYFLQALSLPRNTSKEFLHAFTEGMKSILDISNCSLSGGDIGTSDTWRFTGVAFGKVIDGKHLERILPNEEQLLWVTGSLGDANLAAFTKQPTPNFEYRHQEALLIHKYATACMDTSGGLFDALWTMHQLQPQVAIEINLDAIPYAKGLKEFTKQTQLPIEAALMGGAGEYELLFATKPNAAEKLKTDPTFTQIGAIHPSKQPSIELIKENYRFPMEHPPICPRSLTQEKYILALLDTTRKIFY